MTPAEKQAAYRAREARDRDILAECIRLLHETGELVIPFGMTPEEWASFIDREEARRVRREQREAAAQ